MKVSATHLWIFLCLAALASCISTAATNIFYVLSIVTFVILVYKRKIDMHGMISLTGSKLLLAFFAVLLLSSILGNDVLLSFRETWQVYIYRLLPFFLVGGLYNKVNRMQCEKLFLCLFLSLTITSVAALYQYFFNGNLRPSGLSSHYMHLGGYYVIILPIIIIALLDDNFFDWFKYKKILLIPFAVCVAGFIANNTRGAWITVGFVSVIVLFVLGVRKPKRLLCGLVAIALCASCIANNKYLSERVKSITSTTNQSNVERTLIWGSAFRMISDYPVLGVGPGCFTDLYQKKYISSKAKEPSLRHCHNLFLQVFTENGIIGISSFMLLLGYFILHGIKNFYRTRRYPYLVISTVIIAVMIHGMTEFNATVFKDMWLMIGACYFVLSDVLNDWY